MLILGIDTSCDDTSASVVEDGRRILSNIVSSQHDIHRKYGGIVPELASRRHIEMIWPVVDEALSKAQAGLEDISAIAVCCGPGLIGSLLVGVCFAKSLSYVYNIPLVAVNHLEGHIFSYFLREGGSMVETEFPPWNPEFPFLALVVSGGHTCLYRVQEFGVYKELGRTRDDAGGEAYDKVAKLLGLGYPGGPVIEKAAEKGNPQAIKFPRAFLKDSFDFSFSGLKTAVVNFLKNSESGTLTLNQTVQGRLINDIAASFQAAVIDMLIEKTISAAKKEKLKRVILTGGVAANMALRKNIVKIAEEEDIKVYIPSRHLCTDNGAMIASAGFYHFKARKLANFDLNPKAYLPL